MKSEMKKTIFAFILRLHDITIIDSTVKFDRKKIKIQMMPKTEEILKIIFKCLISFDKFYLQMLLIICKIL